MQCLVIAAWLIYTKNLHDAGQPINDPLHSELTRVFSTHDFDAGLVDSVLALAEIFPKEFQENSSIKKQVHSAFNTLREFGAKKALRSLVELNSEVQI
jgi:mannitol-1-phosphate/altronate dehydrogenase